MEIPSEKIDTPINKGNNPKVSQGIKKRLPLLAIIFFIICFAAAAGFYFFNPSPNAKQQKTVSTIKTVKTAITQPDKLFGWKFPISKFPLTGSNGNLLAYSDIRDPGGTPRGLPVRLQIPTIGVDSAIEDALITPDGRMDVPEGSVNVAWFALGPHPGQVGSAVIGGHFGISNGVPWVFYNLDKLKVGDKVYIVDDNNNTLAFVVRSMSSFDRNADATTVFTSNDGLAHLNLITCEGIWNQVNGTYPQRLVVFTDSIPAEGSVNVSKTQVKVATDQTKVISPTPLPTVTQVSPTVSPTITQVPTIAEKKGTSSPQILIMAAKSLYATPIDSLITSFLLFSIIITTFKIVRRKR